MVKTVKVSAVGDLEEDGGEDGEDVAVQEAPTPAPPRYAPCVAGSKLNNSLLSTYSLP